MLFGDFIEPSKGWALVVEAESGYRDMIYLYEQGGNVLSVMAPFEPCF